VLACRERADKAAVAQRQRELGRLRAELEAAQTVADDEAGYYLNLISQSSDFAPETRRQFRAQGAARPSSPTATIEEHPDATVLPSRQRQASVASPVWTTLAGTATERAHARIAIVEAELGFDKNGPAAIATASAEPSTGPTTLSGPAPARLGLHRNRSLVRGPSPTASLESGVKGNSNQLNNEGGRDTEAREAEGRWSRLLPGLNHSFRRVG